MDTPGIADERVEIFDPGKYKRAHSSVYKKSIVYTGKCPAGRYIPIYLIVFGCFAALLSVLFLLANCPMRENSGAREVLEGMGVIWMFCFIIISAAVGLFLIIWSIAGNVWVYGHYAMVELNNSTSPVYCHPQLYYFTFSVNIVYDIIFSLWAIISVVTCTRFGFDMCLVQTLLPDLSS